MYCFTVYVLLASFSVTYGAIANMSRFENEVVDCGRTRYQNFTLHNMDYSKARIGQFPWVARVGIEYSENKTLHFVCGGTLISRHHVVSEVKCGNIGKVVRLGEYNAEPGKNCDDCGDCSPPPQDIKIRKHIYDKTCTPEPKVDIILLELEKPVTFTEFIQPICLPDKPLSTRSFIDDRLFTPGWGEQSPRAFGFDPPSPNYDENTELMQINTTYNPSELLFVRSVILDPEECNAVYSESLKERDICVGYPKGVKRNCVGDFGGSLVKVMKVGKVKRAVLVGIAKYNPIMCEMDDMPPIVYADVSNYTKWIQNKIESSIQENLDKTGRKYIVE